MDVIIRHRPVVGPLNITGLLALGGILGPLALFIGDYTPALTTPGYHFLRDSISSLAWVKLGWIQTIGFLAMGLLMEMYVAGLLLNIRPRRGFYISAFLLALSGFGLLMIGAFHTDISGVSEPTFQGTLHGVVSKGVFIIFPIATLLISFSIKRDPHWRHLYLYTLITMIIGFLLTAVVYFTIDTEWFGGFERLLVANMIIWVEVTAIQLLRHSLRKRPGKTRYYPFAGPNPSD